MSEVIYSKYRTIVAKLTHQTFSGTTVGLFGLPLICPSATALHIFMMVTIICPKLKNPLQVHPYHYNHPDTCDLVGGIPVFVVNRLVAFVSYSYRGSM